MALSDRQFKRKVFDELKNTGTIDGIKGSLRSRLVGVLQRKDPSVFDGSGPSPGSQNLWQRAANSLYVEYLNHQNYGYALSVFQPECGLTDQQVMSRDEISRVLCLERPSSLSQHLLRPDVGARNADGAPRAAVAAAPEHLTSDRGGRRVEREERDADADGRHLRRCELAGVETRAD